MTETVSIHRACLRYSFGRSVALISAFIVGGYRNVTMKILMGSMMAVVQILVIEHNNAETTYL